MRQKARRRNDRDRARRDVRDRVRDHKSESGDAEAPADEDVDPQVRRALLGYDE